MRHTKQTRFGIKGNCFQAALSSLLDVDISEIPDFDLMDEGNPNQTYPPWYHALQKFLRGRGYCFVEMALTDKTPFYPLPFPAYCLFLGKNKEGNSHAVVGYVDGMEFKAVWNPGTGEGLMGVDSIGWIVPIDPARMSQKMLEFPKESSS